MAENEDRLPPLDELDDAFTLPEVIADQRLRNLYEVIVARMRREAAHLPMNTVQQLLIERIAYNYISLRYREGIPQGEQGGFSHATQQKDFNTFWLSMTQEFNKQLRGSDSEFRRDLLRTVSEVIVGTLPDIISPDDLPAAKERLARAFEEYGL